MKKFIKRLTILLLVSVMVFALCGCDALDDMREHQIFPAEDGSFVIDNARYVRLETNDYFAPGDTPNGEYFLTEKDVPVLLSNQFCIGALELTNDGRFCRDWRRGMWFCREDIFEEMQTKNREPFVPDTLFYTYTYCDKNGEWQDKDYVLSQEEVAAIAEVLKGDPLQLGDGVYISSDWEFGLTEATADLLFRHSGPSIHKAGNSFYVSTHKDTGATTYQVPAELNPIFEKITAAYLAEIYGDTFPDTVVTAVPENSI
ncbi:MAG: hypothetical protein IKU57_03295 [Oscillospiraceae bacterium]|nr:hypothetical protein [Oscillospiraceae bacterium]